MIEDLDDYIPNYSSLPRKDKIAIDIKHLTAGNLAEEFRHMQGGGIHRTMHAIPETTIFLNHAYHIHNLEDQFGRSVTEPQDLLKVGGEGAYISAMIIFKVVDHLFDSAVFTEDERKNL